MRRSTQDEAESNVASRLAQRQDSDNAPTLTSDVMVNEVSAVLQSYAGRGVFQELRRQPMRSDRTAFHFGWLYDQPYTLVCDATRKKLVLTDLFPGVARNSAMYQELKSFLKSRSQADITEHRRLDPSKSRVAALLRGGAVSLEVAVIDTDYRYACTKLIHLAHESFLYLSEYWSDYLHHYFQLDME